MVALDLSLLQCLLLGAVGSWWLAITHTHYSSNPTQPIQPHSWKRHLQRFSRGNLFGLESFTLLPWKLPGTQMTLVLIGKGLLLGGWPSKIEVIWVPGNYYNASWKSARNEKDIHHIHLNVNPLASRPSVLLSSRKKYFDVFNGFCVCARVYDTYRICMIIYNDIPLYAKKMYCIAPVYSLYLCGFGYWHMEDLYIYIHDTHTVIHFVHATFTASICDGNIKRIPSFCTSSIYILGKMTMTLTTYHTFHENGREQFGAKPSSLDQKNLWYTLRYLV